MMLGWIPKMFMTGNEVGFSTNRDREMGNSGCAQLLLAGGDPMFLAGCVTTAINYVPKRLKSFMLDSMALR